MPGPPLLPGPCEGVGARPRPAPKRGTDGPKLLPAGTDSSKEEGHPPHPRGSVQSNGGRHTPELYQCRKGENPPPPRTGREGGFSTPPGLPHCIEGGGVSPPPHPGGSAAGGEANPGRHRGGGGTAPYPSPQPSPQRLLPASVTGAAPAVPPPNRKPAHARLAASRPHPAPARGHLACWQVKPAPLPAAISCEVTSPASG